MKRQHYRRAKRTRREMEIDEVFFTRHWTTKVTSPEPGEVKVSFYRHGTINATLHLVACELEDMGAGFRALADVLDKARGVDEPVGYKP
jgi:hypothetical protein